MSHTSPRPPRPPSAGPMAKPSTLVALADLAKIAAINRTHGHLLGRAASIDSTDLLAAWLAAVDDLRELRDTLGRLDRPPARKAVVA